MRNARVALHHEAQGRFALPDGSEKGRRACAYHLRLESEQAEAPEQIAEAAPELANEWFGAAPVGHRTHLDDEAAAMRLAEIEILPEWQGRGIGSSIVRRLMQEAATAGKPVTLRLLHGLKAGSHQVASSAVGRRSLRSDVQPALRRSRRSAARAEDPRVRR